jgi:hypothetical protein
VEYWRFIRNEQQQGKRINPVAVSFGIAWSLVVGVILSFFALGLPIIAALIVFSSSWK